MLRSVCVNWICCAFSGCSVKASEAMEEQGSTKSPSSGEQGGNSTSFFLGWVANTATCLWPHHKAGNILPMGPHTAPAILFPMKPASVPDTHNTRQAHDGDLQLKTTEQWALDIYGPHWCSISNVGQCRCQAQHTAGWVIEGGLCCQPKGKSTVWGHIYTFPQDFPQDGICYLPPKRQAYVLLASVSKLHGDGHISPYTSRELYHSKLLQY